jgi:hypothetical protein
MDWEQLAARGLDWTALTEHRHGLICLSGGRRGRLDLILASAKARATVRPMPPVTIATCPFKSFIGCSSS